MKQIRKSLPAPLFVTIANYHFKRPQANVCEKCSENKIFQCGRTGNCIKFPIGNQKKNVLQVKNKIC